MKDVSGQLLAVGDVVAYCLGGKGTQMRTGKVLRMTAKSVIIAGSQMQYRGDGKGYTHELTAIEVVRAFDAVSKIHNKGEDK